MASAHQPRVAFIVSVVSGELALQLFAVLNYSMRPRASICRGVAHSIAFSQKYRIQRSSRPEAGR
ncbi:hypothetical protein BDV06DRAFT_189536 [Aspergillus oleicola]